VIPEEPTHLELGAVAIVADVLPSQAVGTLQPTEDDMPFVVSGENGEPTLTFRDDTDLPTDLTAATVIQGDGPQVQTGSRVLLNYLEVSATTRETLATTWPLETGPWGVTVGQGQMPNGLEQSLIDVAQGSRIIVIVPPVEGYGDDRLIFVVDVLAVRNPV
jgi:peptidylprolyl isomerase